MQLEHKLRDFRHGTLELTLTLATDFPPEWLLSMSADHYAHAAWETLVEIKKALGIHIEPEWL
jgi:hypothetical protein